MQTLQKIEDTWYDAPWYCDTEYDSILSCENFKRWWNGRYFARAATFNCIWGCYGMEIPSNQGEV
jgi:hypothetical protein